MGGTVTGADLARDWSLSFADFELVNARPVSAQLGLAVQLKFYALRGYFIETGADVPGEAVSWLAEQLGVGDTDLSSPDVSGRSGRRHRAEILRRLGLRRMTRADRGALSGWIATELCPGDPAVRAMIHEAIEAIAHLAPCPRDRAWPHQIEMSRDAPCGPSRAEPTRCETSFPDAAAAALVLSVLLSKAVQDQDAPSLHGFSVQTLWQGGG